MGYQHGASHTTTTRTQENVAADPRCVIYICSTQVKQRGRREIQRREEEKWRERDTQTNCLLYWTGVPLPWQPAALDWYLEQRFELLQRISCSVHIWGRLIWRQNQLPCFRSHHAVYSQSLVWDTAAGTRPPDVKISHPVPDYPTALLILTDVCAAIHNVGLEGVNIACVSLDSTHYWPFSFFLASMLKQVRPFFIRDDRAPEIK